MRKKKLTHEQKVAALTPPSCGFLKDRNVRRLTPKSRFLLELEANQEVEILLPTNISRMIRR